MSNGPFPLFIDDLEASTLGWTDAQRYAYLRVLERMWRNNGAIPDDAAVLADAANKPPAATLAKIRAKITVGTSGLTHPRVVKELTKKRDIANKRAAAGAAGGAARAQANAKQTPKQTDPPLPPILPVPPTLPIPTQEGSVADATGAAAPAEAPPVKPSAEIDLIGEMPADLRRSPPPKAADRIWGPLREALGLTDADRSFIGRLIRDHGEDAVCAAMAKLAERDLPADPKSQLKAMLKGQAHGQAEQARPNGRAERVAAILARVGGGPAPGGGDGAAPDAGAVLPAVPGGR